VPVSGLCCEESERENVVYVGDWLLPSQLITQLRWRAFSGVCLVSSARLVPSASRLPASFNS